MGIVRFALNGNYKRFYENIKKISKEINKPALLLFFDMSLSTIIFKSGLSDYLNYKFYNLSYKERNKYVTIGYQANFYKKTSVDKDHQFFDNKINFHEKFKIFTHRSYYDPKTGLTNLKKFLKDNPTFVIKPIFGLGGTDVKKMDINEIDDVCKFYDYLIEKELFLEELIIQNKEWGKICPKSVNTLRVMTSVVNGNADIFYIAARIGSGKSVADNFHQGGMGASVDLKRGILIGKGIDKELISYDRHPLSNETIEGYKIPYYEEIKEMCKKAAKVNDQVHVVGWDVALTDNGPLIIEGNNGPGFDLVQVLEKGGTKYMLQDIKKKLKKEKLW